MDVGFTLTAFDGGRIAALAAEAGVEVSGAALDAAARQVRAELAGFSWPQRPASPSPAGGGPRFMARLLALGGARGPHPGAIEAAAEHVWQAHLRRNVWARVLDGVPAALARLRSAGLRLAVVSNSEGTVEALLEEVGLRGAFDLVLDSWHVGVAKPDPRIYRLALDRLGAAPEETAMIGDSPVADVTGPAGVGVRGVLVDPFDLFPAIAPRFPDLARFTDAVLGDAGVPAEAQSRP